MTVWGDSHSRNNSAENTVPLADFVVYPRKSGMHHLLENLCDKTVFGHYNQNGSNNLAVGTVSFSYPT